MKTHTVTIVTPRLTLVHYISELTKDQLDHIYLLSSGSLIFETVSGETVRYGSELVEQSIIWTATTNEEK